MVDKLTFIGGGDGLNAPIRLRVPRDPGPTEPPAIQPDRQPAAPPSSGVLWLLLLAVVGFGSYFAWRESENRRIARGDLTPQEAWEKMLRDDVRRASEAIDRAADSRRRMDGR